MPGLSSRHPRYTIFLTLLILAALFLLLPDSASTPYTFHNAPAPNLSGAGASQLNIVDVGLPGRVSRAERIYEKMLAKRKGLYRKFGGEGKTVVPFPPDKEPWPAYTIWDFFPPAFNCPHEVERIGALGDGGKWVCGLSRLEEKRDCVVYSLGVNGGSSFESELLSRTKHCQVWGYDFTLSSFGDEINNPHSSDFSRFFAQPVQGFYSSDPLAPQDPAVGEDGEEVRAGEKGKEGAKEKEGKEYWNDAGRTLKQRAHFKSYGVAGKDVAPTSEAPPMYTIESLMKMNGHTHIDILKIDLEGWEFDALASFLKSFPTLPIGQLQIELHIWNRGFDELLKVFEGLEGAGLRAFMSEPNLIYQNYNRNSSPELAEYSFVNVKTANAFVSDSPVSNYGYDASAEREEDREREREERRVKEKVREERR